MEQEILLHWQDPYSNCPILLTVLDEKERGRVGLILCDLTDEEADSRRQKEFSGF